MMKTLLLRVTSLISLINPLAEFELKSWYYDVVVGLLGRLVFVYVDCLVLSEDIMFYSSEWLKCC